MRVRTAIRASSVILSAGACVLLAFGIREAQEVRRAREAARKKPTWTREPALEGDLVDPFDAKWKDIRAIAFTRDGRSLLVGGCYKHIASFSVADLDRGVWRASVEIDGPDRGFISPSDENCDVTFSRDGSR